MKEWLGKERISAFYVNTYQRGTQYLAKWKALISCITQPLLSVIVDVCMEQLHQE